MYHLILLMPIIGLGLFWILPTDVALPIYVVLLALSGLIYAVVMKSMRRPKISGAESLLGETVDVIEMKQHEGQVHLHGTIWEATSEDDLHSGDHARVVGINGLTLKVKKSTTVP